MSLTQDEFSLLRNLSDQVSTLRQEIGGYEKAVNALSQQNTQLSKQILELNAENKRLSDWITQVSQQVTGYYKAGQDSEQRLTTLCQQLADELKR